MPSTVAVDDAIRTLSVELTKDKDAAVIGKTEAEKTVLTHYAAKGRRRAAMGAIAGSSVMAGLWKMSKNRQRLAGAFAMVSGGLFGASYGVISIRRDLLSDLLMLPPDKSPFATHARTILTSKIPENTFVQELNEKFKDSLATTDSWTDDADAPRTSGPKPSIGLPSPAHRFDNKSDHIISSTTGFDLSRTKKDPSDDDFGEPNNSESRLPIFFGAKPSSDEASDDGNNNTPLPRDRFTRDTRRSNPDKNAAPLRHDEDDYFFDVAGSQDAPVQPTTWEEIRRRAAEQRK
uniref:Transmembrane protein n=1 Tax=Peronospora matthiolae TaxID=2874970 RepID=A0AAV1TSR9_9STRA